MKKILIATTNQNKVKRLKTLLRDVEYEIISLKDINSEISEPNENANTPAGIAMEKALHYANNVLEENILVLCQDDTLELQGIKEEDNPGLHIKEPVIKKYGKFTDELAAEYYKLLAEKYGGYIPMTFKYGHAIAVKKNRERTVTKVVGAESKLEARLVDKINKLENVPGYFLGALMQVNVNGEWVPYNELDAEQLIMLDKDLYESIKILLEEIQL